MPLPTELPNLSGAASSAWERQKRTPKLKEHELRMREAGRMIPVVSKELLEKEHLARYRFASGIMRPAALIRSSSSLSFGVRFCLSQALEAAPDKFGNSVGSG